MKKQLPDAAGHRPEPAYTAELVAAIKANTSLTSNTAIARQIGVGHTTLKDWLAGRTTCGYPEQYTLEALAGKH